MQFCFIASGDVLTLPITPASYEWTTGKNIETINISQLGDVYLPGNRSRHSGTIECLLPSQDYPFNQPGTILDPGYYLEPLRYWAAEKIPVRYIVTESDINALVYIESVTEKEQDGTGDVYCTIALREYVDLEAQEVATLNTTRYTGNSGRKSDATAKGVPDYGRLAAFSRHAQHALPAHLRRRHGELLQRPCQI